MRLRRQAASLGWAHSTPTHARFQALDSEGKHADTDHVSRRSIGQEFLGEFTRATKRIRPGPPLLTPGGLTASTRPRIFARKNASFDQSGNLSQPLKVASKHEETALKVLPMYSQRLMGREHVGTPRNKNSHLINTRRVSIVVVIVAIVVTVVVGFPVLDHRKRAGAEET